MYKILYTLLCLTLFGLYEAQPYYGNDAVLLTNIRALTFEKGKMTRGRRTSPIPQLQCTGGTAQGRYDYEPSSVQCENRGADSYGNVQWKCEADLDEAVRFGKIEVSCEGYLHPDDEYVLAGSCGLDYSLELTEKGRMKNQGYYNNGWHGNSYNHYEGSNTTGGVARFIMLAIFAFILYGLVRQCMINSQANRPPGTGSYGPGFGSGPGYPPGPGYGPGSGPYDNCNPPPSSYGTGSTWRPGFWTGVGTGGLMSYLFRPRSYGYPGYNSYGSSYGGGYRSNSFGSSFGSPSSSGTTSRTATGFGGTRRR